MSQEILLFDIPSRGDHPRCWSLNPWKARAALNFKSLPYKTQWVEYPDIAPLLKSHNVPPNDPGSSYAEWSSPAARFPDGKYIMDSRKIAVALEHLQPEPSLHVLGEENGKVIDRVQKAVLGTQGALAPIAIPRVPEKILNEKSVKHFSDTRAKRFGMPLPELAKSDRAGENAWKNAEASMQELKAVLEEKEGPYVLGKEAGFADLVLAGYWVFLKFLDEGGDLFERTMKWDGSFKRHWQASEKWFEKDD